MKGKILFATGLAVGYVLGTKAGRERYEQISSAASRFWNTPAVQHRVDDVETFVRDKAPDVAEFVADGTKKVVNQVMGGSSKSARKTRGQSSATPAKPRSSTAKSRSTSTDK